MSSITPRASDIGIDLGKARVKVEIFDAIRATRGFADVGLIKSQEFLATSEANRSELFSGNNNPPFNLDSIIVKSSNSPTEDGYFGAIMPKAKFYQVHNIMTGFGTGSSELPDKRVEWSVPAKAQGLIGVQKQYIEVDYPDMPWETGPNYTPDYQGARWVTTTVDKMPWDPLDAVDISSDSIAAPAAGADPSVKNIFDLTKMCIAQESVAVNNLFWGIETHGLDLPDNFPFYIDIHRSKRLSQARPSFINIRLNPAGASGTIEQFDITLVDGTPPRIQDMKMLAAEKKLVKLTSEMDSSISNSDYLRVGILPVFGRLVVYVNGNYFIYGRPNFNISSGATGTITALTAASINTFSTVPFKLKTETVQIWGNNCMAKVYMGFMTFPTGRAVLPFEANYDANEDSTVAWESLGKAMPYNKDNKILGHCAKTFYNEDTPVEAGAKVEDVREQTCPNSGMGYIKVKMVQQPGTKNFQYRMAMQGQDATLVKGVVTLVDKFPAGLDSEKSMPYVGPPFLFRLRGIQDLGGIKSMSGGGAYVRSSSRSVESPRSFYLASRASRGTDISDDVLSVTRNFTSPDMFHCEQTAEVSFYNPSGVHDNLTQKGKCIQISMGWDSPKLVFTGVTLGGSRSEVAGKEVLTIHCEDYTRILADSKMLNSPYYDGAETFTAFEDIAKRAGIIPIDDSTDPEFYLPCGYSFTTPKFKVGNYTTIKEALLSTVKPGERCFYFDENGTLHMDNIQGSLFFTTSYDVIAKFYRDPDKSSDGFNVVLDERKVDHPVGSVHNQILLKTTDRTSGAVHMGGVKATASENLLLYKKIYFSDMAYLASKEACDAYAQMLRGRMFKVPVIINFTTITKDVIFPLSFISVDDKDFRVKSLTESLNAEDNSFSTTITAEWMGT